MPTEPSTASRKPLQERGSGKTPPRSIRVPDADWEAWQAAAREAGLSLSEWIRTILNDLTRE